MFDNNNNHKIDEFLNKFIKINKNIITIYRDWNFLKWRFLNNPYSNNKIYIIYDKSNEISGLIVLGESIENRKILLIKDIISLDYKFTNKLIKFSLYYMKKNNYDCIEIWSGENKYYKTLNKSLFANNFLAKRSFMKKMIIWSNSLNHKMLKNKENWYITMAFLRI